LSIRRSADGAFYNTIAVCGPIRPASLGRSFSGALGASAIWHAADVETLTSGSTFLRFPNPVGPAGLRISVAAGERGPQCIIRASLAAMHDIVTAYDIRQALLYAAN
jgi:hypothetical protein